MNKNLMKKIIFGILVLIWMIGVFCFSHQSSEESSNTSEEFIRANLIKMQSFKNLNVEAQNQKIEQFQYPIRKLAHFSSYALGGFLILNFINLFSMDSKKKIIYAISVGAIFAISDEIHQLFIPGRSGQISDVLLDTSGVLFGVLIYIGIIKLLEMNKK